jgi:filamentous hemagglutinin
LETIADDSPNAIKARQGADEAAVAKEKLVADISEQIRSVLADSPLRTQQERVSISKIQEYVEIMRSGEDMGSIKVDGDVIVDGHHRYIASRIIGIDIEQTPWTRPMFKQNMPSSPISEIELDSSY